MKIHIARNVSPEQAALYLVYVNDQQPEIRRIKNGKDHRFEPGDQPAKENGELNRIKRLAIPPATGLEKR